MFTMLMHACTAAWGHEDAPYCIAAHAGLEAAAPMRNVSIPCRAAAAAGAARGPHQSPAAPCNTASTRPADPLMYLMFTPQMQQNIPTDVLLSLKDDLHILLRPLHS